jgi:hypothetical protein
MNADAKPLSRGRRIALGINGALWVVTTVLLSWLPWPPFNLEAWLVRHFPTGHADQYEFVNRLIKPPISLGLVAWLGVCIGFIIARRYKLLLINVAGPIVSMLMVAPTEDWSDPQWFTIGAFISIGGLVSLLVTGLSSIGAFLDSRCRVDTTQSPNGSQPTLPLP